MKLTPIIRLVSLLLLSGLTARAQSNVSVTFQTVQLTSIPPNLSYQSGGQYTPVSVGLKFISTKSYTYSGNATMLFYAPAASPASTAAGVGGTSAASKMTPVGSVTFPGSGKFLVVTNTQSDGSFYASVVSAETSDFPAGAIRFVNTTSVPFIAVCNDKRLPVKANDSAIYKGITDPILTFRVLVLNKAGKENEAVTNGGVNNLLASRTSVFVVLNNAAALKKDPKADPDMSMLVISENPNAPAATTAGTTASGRTGNTAGRRGTAGTAGRRGTAAGG